MLTAQEVIGKLADKARRNSCINCNHLRIKNGEIWCRLGVIEKFHVLDPMKLKKMVNRIIRNNNCEFREEE